MKSREETARFIENQFESKDICEREKKGCRGYGWQDLRVLLDFIYEGKPETIIEELTNADEYRKY